MRSLASAPTAEPSKTTATSKEGNLTIGLRNVSDDRPPTLPGWFQRRPLKVGKYVARGPSTIFHGPHGVKNPTL